MEETTTQILETTTEITENVVNHLTPEQWQYVYSVVQKFDVYIDYIAGFLLFFVLVIVLKYSYKFFNMFF